MKNWVRKKISEISTVFEDGDWIESKDQSTDGIRLIQTGNVGNGIFKDRGEKARYISEATFKRLRCTEIFEGDCLVSRLPDPVGRACILPDTGEKMITAVDCTIIRFDHHQIIPNWFLYYSLSNEYQNEIQKQVTGATRQRISRKNLGLVSVPVAPLPEQQRIVSILDECFAAIDKAKANAEQNLKNSKELFESYLQGVFDKKGEGWEEKTLGDVCTLYQGIAINAKTKHALVKKSDLPLLRIKDLKNNTVEQFIDPNNFPKNALVNEEDIIYTRTGSLGLVFRRRKGVLHNNSFKVVPNKQLDKDYLFIWLQNPTFKSKIMELALKAAQPDITHAIFKIQEIAIPPLKEQQTIVRQLDALRAETQKLEAVYEKKIADLEELKKSILQKAFAGELKTSEKLVTI